MSDSNFFQSLSYVNFLLLLTCTVGFTVLYSIEYTTKDKIFNVKTDKLYCFFANIHSFWIWCLQHVLKDLGQGHVYYCITSPLLLRKLNKYLDPNCWSVVCEIFLILAWYTTSVAQQWGVCCHILPFIMRHTFSMGDRSGLQAGQSSSRTLLLRSHIVVTCA